MPVARAAVSRHVCGAPTAHDTSCLVFEGDADATTIHVHIEPTPSRSRLRSMVHAAAALPFVHWVEFRPVVGLRNAETVAVLHGDPPGGDEGSRPSAAALDAMGLDGTGQLVGMADAGLDLRSCFFRDTSNAVPGARHRKVAALRLLGDGNHSSGHGTHVAGTLLGASDDVRLMYQSGVPFSLTGLAVLSKCLLKGSPNTTRA